MKFGDIKLKLLQINTFTIAISLIGLVVACVPATTFDYAFRPNTSLAKKDTDVFECKVASTQQVPTNNKVSTTPVYTTPVTCNNIGGIVSCYGGDTFGGNVVITDANAGLRRQYLTRCMVSRGYSLTVGVPECSDKQRKNLTAETIAALNSKIRPYKAGACFGRVQNVGQLLYLEE